MKRFLSAFLLSVISCGLLSACGGNSYKTTTPTPKQAGIITEFPLPNPHSSANGITAGPGGNLWFTECVWGLSGCFSSQIGRITPGGQVTEFPLSDPNSGPWGITAGPDGNLWFTELYDNVIGRITPGGQVTEFSLPNPNSQFETITAGPDGNLWFTETSGIGRILLRSEQNGLCTPSGKPLAPPRQC